VNSLLEIPAFDNLDELQFSRRISGLRCQLLTAVAGTLLEAKAQRAATAVLVIHEFRTSATDDANLQSNADDLDEFLALFWSRNGGPDELVCLAPGNIIDPISVVEGRFPVCAASIRISRSSSGRSERTYSPEQARNESNADG
jgi:hypothetical protein